MVWTMSLNSDRSVSEVELSAETCGCKAKVAKAVELPSTFLCSAGCSMFYGAPWCSDLFRCSLNIPEWCLQFVWRMDIGEMRLDFFPCAERSGKKQPHHKGAIDVRSCVTPPHCNNPVSLVRIVDGPMCHRCASSQATSNLLFHFAFLFKKLGPLGAIAWVLAVDPVEAWALLRSIALASHFKSFKPAWTTYSTVLNIGHPGHLLQWPIMVHKNLLQVYVYIYIKSSISIYTALSSWSKNQNLKGVKQLAHTLPWELHSCPK